MMKKKVLLSSITTIALCMSLIAGSTFALFTSQSQVNVAVTSGNVDVVASVDGGIKYTSSLGTVLPQSGATLAEDGNTITISNMVPGDTATFNIRITNNSTVNVKYRTRFVQQNGADSELLKALKIQVEHVAENEVSTASLSRGANSVVTPYGKLEPGSDDMLLKVTITMPEDVTAEKYEGVTCALTYMVEAVQANGKLDDTFLTQLTELNNTIKSGVKNIYFANDVTIDVHQNDNYSAIRVDKSQGAADVVTLDGDATVTSNYFLIWAREGAKVIVNGGNYVSTGNSHLVYANLGGIVEINGGTFSGATADHFFNISNSDRGSIIIKGGLYSRDPSTQIASNDVWNGTTGVKIEEGYKVVEENIDGTIWYRVVPET